MKKYVSTILMVAALSQPGIAAEPLSLSTIDVPEPIKYRMDYVFPTVAAILLFGGPSLANKARNNGMSDRLTSAMFRDNYRPNKLLIDEIESNLTAAGIAISEKTKVSISPTEPDQVNYSKINLRGNALLHVFVEKIGLQARKTNYQPFIHVSYCLVLPKDNKDCAYGDRSYYGDGYTEEDYLVYPADIADQFVDEDDAMRRASDVRSALTKGLSKIAGGVSKDVIKYLTEPEKQSAN